MKPTHRTTGNVTGLLAVVALVALIASACGGSGRELSEEAQAIFAGECVADSGDTVTIYSGRTENLISPILEAFACETGIDVRVRWGSSTDLAVLINEEGDATEADVFLSRSPGPVGFLESNDLLGTLEAETLALVSADNQASTGSWVGFSGRKRLLVYNVDQVTAADLPSSVFELTGEAYRGRVALPATNGSFEDWFTVFRDQFGTEAATQWLDDMVANDAKYYPNNRSIVEAAGRGEIDIGLVNHYYNYQEAAAIGADHHALNHDLAADDIGSLLIITAASITEASDNAEQAHELLRYLLSEPVQRYYTEETFEYPLAAGVQPADILPPLSASEVSEVDFDSLGGGMEDTLAIIEASGIANQ